MRNAEIIPIEYGKSVLAESMVFSGGKSDKFQDIVFMVYLIKAENKLILVDAGCTTMPDFDMSDFIGPVKALEKIGVKPDDITDVLITHAHHDHIECANCFKNATVYIQKNEYENGKEYLSQNEKIVLFESEIELCGGVKAVKIGGHSIGSCVVEISDGGKVYVIAGDECYSRQCIEKKIPTGTSYCPSKSREFIEEYGSGKYEVLLCHDK